MRYHWKTITIEYDAKALTASNGTLIDNTATTIAAGIPEKKDAKQVYVNSPKIDVEKQHQVANIKWETVLDTR